MKATIGFWAGVCILGFCPMNAVWGDETLAEQIAARTNQLTIDDDDPLLFQLEQDFIRLLKKSRNPLAMLRAEEYLNETNDNTHWTSYSKATSEIRKSPERAAIPLLLRFMVLHTQRSSRHIMIPEYAKTVSLLSGRKIDKSHPKSEKAMRVRVQAIVDEWWQAESKRKGLTKNLTPEQLQIISLALLEETRRNGDYRGSGGKMDTAYRAYHNVFYRIPGGSSSDRHQFNEIRSGMAKYVLQPSGFSVDGKPTADPSATFAYEAIPILAALVNRGDRAEVSAIAKDRKQNSSVRMICILAMFRAGEPFDGKSMIEILRKETRMQRRLIGLCSLRWAGSAATDFLLEHLNDSNIEIATAAATALTETKPKAAIPTFRKLLLQRDHPGAPLLILSSLAEYQTADAIQILGEMLQEAVEDKSKEKHLGRILSAYIDATNLPRPNWSHKDYDKRAAAKLALAQYRERSAKNHNQHRVQMALLESTRSQLRVATEIYELRKSEYKRLLALQGDEIVTADESRAAYDKMKLIEKEVADLKKRLLPLEATTGSLE